MSNSPAEIDGMVARRAFGAARRRRGRRSSPGRGACRPAASGPRRAPARGSRACPAATTPVESRAPHFTSDSSARLFTTVGSTRSVKSQIEVNGAAFLARANDRAACGLADVLHGVQAEADLALDDGEVDLRLVHVRRQHVDVQVVAGLDVEGHLVLRVHDRGDERRHVLARMVRLQPGGAVGDERVAGGVRLVEGVVLGLLHVGPELIGSLCRNPV